MSINQEVNNEILNFKLNDNLATIEHLKCCICLDLFNKPTRTNECNHIFCHDCINNYFDDDYMKDCPSCRRSIYKHYLKHDFLIDSIISSLMVICSQKECGKIITIAGIETHIKNECEYYEWDCRFEFGSKFRKSNLSSHEKCCLKNPIVEINCDKCNEKILAVNRNTHLNKTCPEQIVSCKYCCNEKIKRKDIQAHNKEFAEQHAENVYDKAIELMRENKVLKKRNQDIQNRMNEVSHLIKNSPSMIDEVHVGFGRYNRFVPEFEFNSFTRQINNILTKK